MDNSHEFYTTRGYEIINQHKGKLTSSMEDYLEMLYRIHLAEGYARIGQLAESLNVKASSASKTVQKLAQLGYLDYEKYQIIHLTEEGIEAGAFLLNRHITIALFLQNLGGKEEIHPETELIEHYVSNKTLEKFHLFNQFFQLNPCIKESFENFIHEKGHDK